MTPEKLKKLAEFASRFLDTDITPHELFSHPIKPPLYMMKAKVRLRNMGLHEAGAPETYPAFWSAVEQAVGGGK